MPLISAEQLTKHFGETKALQGLDLEVHEGTVLGVLGPNGAGKTTAVRILTTLLKPDSGRAVIDGVDVAADPRRVRSRIGLTGQYAAVDERLTARENLELVGRFFRMSGSQAKERAGELLDRFSLDEAGDRVVSGFSGGMRRRLTTQYLDEADRLANEIVVIDRGHAIATGTADELKDLIGGARAEVTVSGNVGLADVVSGLGDLISTSSSPTFVDGVALVPVRSGVTAPVAVRALDGAGVAIDDLVVARPTLDDVFLTLTGHAAEESDDPSGEHA